MGINHDPRPHLLWDSGISFDLLGDTIWRLIMRRLAWFSLALLVVATLWPVPASAQVEKATVKINGMI